MDSDGCCAQVLAWVTLAILAPRRDTVSPLSVRAPACTPNLCPCLRAVMSDSGVAPPSADVTRSCSRPREGTGQQPSRLYTSQNSQDR